METEREKKELERIQQEEEMKLHQVKSIKLRRRG